MKNYKLDSNVSVLSDNNFSYEEYKEIVNEYVEKDSRELNFQNRVLIPMLEKLLINSDIVVADTSTLYYRGKKNSKTLDNFQFMAKDYAPPDLVLAINWNIDNISNAVEYIAAIEIKSPESDEHIYGKDFNEYPEHVITEVKAHLSCIDKVILTDCYRWQFFESEFVDTPPIDLVDENKQWKESFIVINDFASELLGIKQNDKTTVQEPKEWRLLQQKILSFVGLE